MMSETPETLDHTEIEEQQLVDRYLLGQLPTEEARRFEVHYLSCPECMERLELTETLLHGLRRAAAQDAAALRGGVLAALLRRRWLAPALAAILLLLPSGLLLQKLKQRSAALQEARGELESLKNPQAGIPYLPLRLLRAAGTGVPTHHLRLPKRPGPVMLALELDPPLAASYRVALLDFEKQQIWEWPEVVPNRFDSLMFFLHSTYLEPGDYQLRATPTTGPDLRVPFRVLPAAL